MANFFKRLGKIFKKSLGQKHNPIETSKRDLVQVFSGYNTQDPIYEEIRDEDIFYSRILDLAKKLILEKSNAVNNNLLNGTIQESGKFRKLFEQGSNKISEQFSKINQEVRGKFIIRVSQHFLQAIDFFIVYTKISYEIAVILNNREQYTKEDIEVCKSFLRDEINKMYPQCLSHLKFEREQVFTHFENMFDNCLKAIGGNNLHLASVRNLNDQNIISECF